MEHKKQPFYKKWWGVILVIIFWPILIPYVLWDLDKWHLHNKKASRSFTKKEMIAPYFLLFVILIVIFFNLLPETQQEIQQKEDEKQSRLIQEKIDNEKMALKGREVNSIVFAESIIKKILKSPATADFGDVKAYELLNQKDIWVVNGYVDSQNSYGAMLRSVWEVQLDFTDGKGGSVKSIMFDGKKIQ